MLLSTYSALINALWPAQSLASSTKQSRKDAAAQVGDGHHKFAALNPRAAFFREIIGSSSYSDHNKEPSREGLPLKVGIIGAGAAGLYAAMLLDSLGIDYDIYEGSDRVGGRIYTYFFDEETWSKSTPQDPAYYDYYVRISRAS